MKPTPEEKCLPFCQCNKCYQDISSPSPEARVESSFNIKGLFILCDKCTKPLNEQGGLIFSPPDKFHQLKKYHICVNCWEELKAWSLSKVVAHEARVDWESCPKHPEGGLRHKFCYCGCDMQAAFEKGREAR